MIYLDYSATTPISLDVLDAMNRTYKEYIGNPGGELAEKLLHTSYTKKEKYNIS